MFQTEGEYSATVLYRMIKNQVFFWGLKYIQTDYRVNPKVK